MTIERRDVTVTTAANGVGSGVINFGFNSEWAECLRLKVDYATDFDAGGDITVTDSDGTLLAKSNTKTDFDGGVSAGAVLDASAAAVSGAWAVPVIKGPVTVAVAQGGDTKKVTVSVWLKH